MIEAQILMASLEDLRYYYENSMFFFLYPNNISSYINKYPIFIDNQFYNPVISDYFKMAIPQNHSKFRLFCTDYNFLLFFSDNDFLEFYNLWKLDNFLYNEKNFDFDLYFSFSGLIEQTFYTNSENTYLYINPMDNNVFFFKFFNDFLDSETIIHLWTTDLHRYNYLRMLRYMIF